MRKVLAAAAALAAAACQQQPPPTPAEAPAAAEWTQQSPDHRFELQQRRDLSGCRVQAVVLPGQKVLWTSQTCLPTSSGLVFLSPDGERLLALDLFPSAASAQAPDWTHLPLVSVWARGAVVRQYRGGELLAPERAADMSKVLSWVRGDSSEQVRQAARATPDGERVLVELADGRTATLGFGGDPLPAPTGAPAPTAKAREEPEERAQRPDPDQLPARPEASRAADAAAAALAADDQGLYRWEDEEGGLHFGNGSQVPARFRKRARPVSGSVGVVPLDRAVSAPAQPAPPAARPPQPRPPAPAPASEAAPPAESVERPR